MGGPLQALHRTGGHHVSGCALSNQYGSIGSGDGATPGRVLKVHLSR
jgi:hypothetical protein